MARWIIFLQMLFLSMAMAAPNPDAALVDQNGKAFRFHDLKGNYVFVSFLFTRCPNMKICPMTVKLNKRVEKLAKEAKIPLKFLFVTLDPKADTPKVLKSYATANVLDPKTYTLASGDEKVLEAFASNWNVIAIPENGTINHNAKSALLAPDLSDIKMYRDNEWTPESVLSDLQAHQKTLN